MNRKKLQKAVKKADEEYAYDMDFYHFHQARRTMWSFAYSFHEATQEERIYHLQEANEQLQKILEPAPVEDYDAIPYEELLERYNFIQTRRDEVNKLFGDRRRRPYTFKECVVINCNRVKATITESYESMKKRIRKNNNEQN